MKPTPYTTEFYNEQRTNSRRSAEEIVPTLVELIAPRSVVDVGCGVGPWLSVFRDHGVEDVFGIDGSYVDPDLLEIPKERFFPADLSQPVSLARTFDLAISLEVAEHLPASSAAVFIESLTKLAPVIFFSAAIPHQGGIDHINEQWPDYWASLFAEKGFVPVDSIRTKFWTNPNVEHCYSQNGILYVRQDKVSGFPKLDLSLAVTSPLPLVHPLLFLEVYEELVLKRDFYERHKIPDCLPKTSLTYELKLIFQHVAFLPSVAKSAIRKRLRNLFRP